MDFVNKHCWFISFKRTWRLSIENGEFGVISGNGAEDEDGSGGGDGGGDGDDCKEYDSEFMISVLLKNKSNVFISFASSSNFFFSFFFLHIVVLDFPVYTG